MAYTGTKMEVPYLSKAKIEAQAGLLLEAYGREKQKDVTPPIPVDSIVENFLKLKLSFMKTLVENPLYTWSARSPMSGFAWYAL